MSMDNVPDSDRHGIEVNHGGITNSRVPKNDEDVDKEDGQVQPEENPIIEEEAEEDQQQIVPPLNLAIQADDDAS